MQQLRRHTLGESSKINRVHPSSGSSPYQANNSLVNEEGEQLSEEKNNLYNEIYPPPSADAIEPQLTFSQPEHETTHKERRKTENKMPSRTS